MGSVQILREVVHDTTHLPWSNSRAYRVHHHNNFSNGSQSGSSQLRRTPSMSHSSANQSASSPSQSSPAFRTRPESSFTSQDTSNDSNASSTQDTAVKTAETSFSSNLPPSQSEKSMEAQSSNVPAQPLEAQSQTDTKSTTQRIKLRDLQHIQSYDDDALSRIANSRPPSPTSDDEEGSGPPPQYEISDMPVSDVIEMVAGLLTKITTTNDAQHEHLHRQLPTAESAMNLSQQTASVLAFHGKNVPNITIMSYLTRIHKYCPATFEVFLSLLVYFDRMTDKVNAGPLQSMKQSQEPVSDQATSVHEDEKQADFTDKEHHSQSSGLPSPPLSDSDPCGLQHFFVVDSYNIHRLVIAGVTCASKFFSDIFYTNSRYAKVGGLPLPELNHLELQFLLLNDFRLSITTEELEAYATMLVEFYAREVMEMRREEAARQDLS